jgi:hypothetical protein
LSKSGDWLTLFTDFKQQSWNYIFVMNKLKKTGNEEEESPSIKDHIDVADAYLTKICDKNYFGGNFQ